MLVVGTIDVVGADTYNNYYTNPEIQRLIAEKQQKIATLEKCSKKVKGFKIAGISTIGLTAVGVAGNVALSNKREEVSNQLTTAKQTLAKQQAAAEEARKKAECDKDSNKEWKDGECKDKPKPKPAATGGATATDDNQGKANTDAGNATTTETITEGRIVGKECISGDLSYKASAGKYIKLARAFTIEKDKWSSLRCWLDDKKTAATDCSCAATACADNEYEIKQGLCIKKTEEKAETAEAKEKTSETTTTTTTTVKLDTSKDGVGCLFKYIDDGKPYIVIDGTYNKCSVSSDGDWCVQFDDYIVGGTSTCTADSGTRGQTTNKNYGSAKSDGQYCYCKMTSWTPNGGSQQNQASSWVFRYGFSDAAICADSCVLICGDSVRFQPDFRGAVFGDSAK